MTLEKAIEILQARLDIPFIGKNPDTKAAIRLGIEALKQVRAIRHAHPQFKAWELPGETKE